MGQQKSCLKHFFCEQKCQYRSENNPHRKSIKPCHLILKSQHAKCSFLQIQIINQWILIFLAPPQSNLAPLFCVRANGKRAYNPSKSRKRFKSKAVPSFLGDAGLIKVVLEFLFGYPKCHFLVPEYGHFWQKYPAQHPPKMMAQIV